MLIGVLLISGINYVPYIGSIISFLVFLLGLGVIVNLIINKEK